MALGDSPEPDPCFDDCDEASDTFLQAGKENSDVGGGVMSFSELLAQSWAEALQRRGALFQVCPFEKPSPIQKSMVTHWPSASFICLVEADLGEVCRGLRGRASKMNRRAVAAGISSTRAPCSLPVSWSSRFFPHSRGFSLNPRSLQDPYWASGLTTVNDFQLQIRAHETAQGRKELDTGAWRHEFQKSRTHHTNVEGQH